MDRRDALKLSAGAIAGSMISATATQASEAESFGSVMQYFRNADAVADAAGYTDPALRATYHRHVLMTLAGAYVQVFGTSVERPDWVPYIPYHMPYIAPNPDTVYHFAPIDAKGRYRISGRKGTESIATLTLRDGGAHLGKLSGNRVGEIDINALEADANGEFSLVLSAKRPRKADGQWFALPPTTTCIMARHVLKDASQADGTCVIERLDARPKALAITDAEFADRTAMTVKNAATINRFVMEYINGLRKKGAEKGFVLDDQTAYGGLADQIYFFHLYDLAPDEALLIECDAPSSKYWSLQLFDLFATTLEYVTRQTSLNDHQAGPDADGRLRFVVSPTDPGLANWLDTAGWRKGGMIWRWNAPATPPKPAVTTIKLGELKRHLPKGVKMVSPAERLAALGARAGFYQSRRR